MTQKYKDEERLIMVSCRDRRGPRGPKRERLKEDMITKLKEQAREYHDKRVAISGKIEPEQKAAEEYRNAWEATRKDFSPADWEGVRRFQDPGFEYFWDDPFDGCWC
ncbi:hypothetical protein BAUCODRAFT_295188 [Baudoinia panamericana UAMH 10762]|uniref:Uncharacterized protein n=1 Tax=Baudoinia panamericana (strain UAMH 10762) TaxID=717646 RepID=M2N1N6_BAUPA|nr:uncharacterized protein BAUCODRAFT_295188 [Baudoinia panamericana UAMH 10762]EMC92540.1 hypothetical protein BAUCODRAFT_295188 [Baudoinia panamericana UAMH 10762]